MILPDIKTDNDIRTLIYSFYDRVQEDPLLGPVFIEEEQVDWAAHLPVIVNFWSSLLLGRAAYRGHPFPRHLEQPGYEAHFRRWLTLFFENIDEQFAGPKAEEAKTKALSLATLFQHEKGPESAFVIAPGRF